MRLCRESAAEFRQDRQIGVEADAFDAAYAEREERPFVLEPSELSLDGAAAAVQLARPFRGARDQRVQSIRLDPHGRGLALPGRAAPLGRAALVVGPANVHSPCSHDGGLCSPRLTRVDFTSAVTGAMPRSMQPSWIGAVS